MSHLEEFHHHVDQSITQALHCTMLTMGADRILFAADYPYEDYAEGGDLARGRLA
jgi:predicted TIM-barrel fold metal-dependent hydrolase